MGTIQAIIDSRTPAICRRANGQETKVAVLPQKSTDPMLDTVKFYKRCADTLPSGYLRNCARKWLAANGHSTDSEVE